MRKLLISAAAAATLFAAGPATAQILDFHAPGVGVQIGPDRPYHRHWRDRAHDGYYHYGWADRPCRTVTVRERMPDGRVIVRTRERC